MTGGPVPPDAVRDYLALLAAARRADREGCAAVIAAQDGDLYPLLRASLALVRQLVEAAGGDVDEWVTRAQATLRASTL